MGLPSCLGDIRVAGIVHVPARAVAVSVGVVSSVTTSAAAVCRVMMVVGNEVRGAQAAAGEASRVHILLGAMGGLEWTTGTGWSTGDASALMLYAF